MKKPRVSIITSIYKSSKFLFDFLLDVKRQSIFNDSEVLLLDANQHDANEDYEIIKPFLDIENFKYLKVGEKTVYETWNIGIEISKSEIICNWNTDDRRSIFSLEKQVEFLEKNIEYDVCYGPSLITSKPNDIFETTTSKEVFPAFESTLENHYYHNSPHCFPVWRKSIHDRFGLFDTSYKSAADYDMWFKLLKNQCKFKNLHQLVGLYYYNPDGISTNLKNKSHVSKEENDIRNKYI